MFDIIGDIHGYGDALDALLAQLGYSRDKGSWRHPERKVIFLGDYVDRGPQQLSVLDTVRRMIDSGNALAIMGNHELNAIAFATQDEKGSYLRPHTSKNRDQHAAFLAAVGEGSALHREWVAWFTSLPMWLDLGVVRAVHACWHAELRDTLAQVTPTGALTDTVLQLAHRKGTVEHRAVDVLLKGPEIRLPDGMSFFDKDGHQRHAGRLKWWDRQALTYGGAIITGTDSEIGFHDVPLPEALRVTYADDVPVFFGHYWLDGPPRLTATNAACLDFSVAKGGYLVAYSYDGESVLSAEKLTSVRPHA